MTKKQLKWRLSELPTGSEVAELVEQEIITKDEAREILFNEQGVDDDADKVKALEEQVKFLQKVVDALSQRKHTTITYTTPYTWYGGGIGTYYTASSTGTGTTYSVNTAQLLNQ